MSSRARPAPAAAPPTAFPSYSVPCPIPAATPRIAPVRVPVARPELPHTGEIVPYLTEIDASRVYSNFGPLVRRFEARLAAHYALPGGTVAALGSGTQALTATLLALNVPRGSVCLLPAWTFVATAHAAYAAGLEPWLLDVEETTWALTPELAEQALTEVGGRVGAVIPVAPFGLPPDTAAWDRFTARTGIPVAIDAAAAFDGLRPGRTPSVVSLHATKALGVGEGALIVSSDPQLIRAIERTANFGFLDSRTSYHIATNAKLSEYGAAVGLAALDRWPQTRARLHAVAQGYRDRLDAAGGVHFQAGNGDAWVASTCVVRFANRPAEAVAERLRRHGIDSRRWWEQGLHHHPAFRDAVRGPLPVTDRLAGSTLGLPCFVDLPGSEIERICALLSRRR